uniref:Uncharacterized protein n=1 Tax=Musca domestica TaxID=7370 RepID=A0A1I8M152_MUSDO
MANIKVYIFLIFLCLQDSVVQGKVIDFSKNSKLQKYLEVHRCRQECFAKTLNAEVENWDICRDVPDCYMCYDYCEMLPKLAMDLAHSMCSDEVYCSKGCRIACRNHQIMGVHTLVYETQQL